MSDWSRAPEMWICKENTLLAPLGMQPVTYRMLQNVGLCQNCAPLDSLSAWTSERNYRYYSNPTSKRCILP